jgi:hypothetical protein
MFELIEIRDNILSAENLADYIRYKGFKARIFKKKDGYYVYKGNQLNR